MIWLIGVICVIVAVVFVFHSNAMSMKTRNKDNENKKNTLKYVALGDSISTGTGAEKGYTKKDIKIIWRKRMVKQ